MTTITIDKYTIEPNAIPLGTVGSYGVEALQFEFSDDWTGLTVETNFYAAGSSTPIAVVLTDDIAEVPAEVTSVAGVGKLVVRGLADGVCINTVTALLLVSETEINPEPTPVTPSEMDQVLAILNDTKEIAQSVRDEADQGAFDGVSVANAEVNAEGHLVVTLSDGNTIDTGYVIGPQGEQGEQGVSVESAAINADNHLIITLSDGSTIDAGAVEGYVTDADLAEAEETILYDGVGSDTAIVSAPGASQYNAESIAIYRAGDGFAHILIPLKDAVNLSVAVASSSPVSANITLVSEDPGNDYSEGDTISYAVRGNNIVAGASWNGVQYSNYFTQAKYAWLNTKYLNHDIAFASIILAMADGSRIELVEDGTINLRALGTFTLGTRISALEEDNYILNVENKAVRRYRNEIDYTNDPSCNYSVASASPYGYYFAINRTTFAYKTYLPASLALTWDAVDGATNYVVKIGDRKYTTTATSLSVTNLIPGKKYKYEVAALSGNYNKTVIKTGYVNTEGQIRMIDASNVFNIRDLGGWQTKFGKRIEYGKIFRGAAFDDTGRSVLTAEGAAEIMANGITVEVDLRGDSGIDYDTVYLKERIHTPVQSYTAGLQSGTAMLAALRAIMSSVTSGKGVYIHCRQGADRAGTVSFLLESLLGVSVVDATTDYEITSFSNYQDLAGSSVITPRNGTSFVAMLTYLNTFAGDDMTEKVENYYVSIGGTADEINAFRAAMLGKTYVA